MSRLAQFAKLFGFSKAENARSYVEQRIAHAETMMTGDFQTMYGQGVAVCLEPDFDAKTTNKGLCRMDVFQPGQAQPEQYYGALFVQDDPQLTAETLWAKEGEHPSNIANRAPRGLLLNSIGKELGLSRATATLDLAGQNQVIGGVNPRHRILAQ